MNTPNAENIFLNPNNPAHVFIAGSKLTGSAYAMTLNKSLNGGTTWSEHIVCSESSYGYAVAFNPFDDNVIYVGGRKRINGALFKTSNGGSTWKELGAGFFEAIIRDVAVDRTSPNRIYAGSASGLYKSDDAGETWRKISSFDAACINLNPESPAEICAGGQNGLYHSTDYGNSWTELDTGFAGKTISCLGRNPNDRVLYAGTSGGSISRKRDADLTFIFPPLDPAGKMRENRSLFQIEYLVDLTWDKNPQNPDGVKYRIYFIDTAGRQLQGEVNATTFEYRQKNLKAWDNPTFAIVAVDAAGREGGAAYLSVKGLISPSSAAAGNK